MSLIAGLDHAGRKVMRIRDLNDERPTSAIFRDSKLEPLKISVTPSIARDRVLLSPDENGVESVVPALSMSNLRPRTKTARTIASAPCQSVLLQIPTLGRKAMPAKRKTPRKDGRTASLAISSERDPRKLRGMKIPGMMTSSRRKKPRYGV